MLHFFFSFHFDVLIFPLIVLSCIYMAVVILLQVARTCVYLEINFHGQDVSPITINHSKIISEQI